MRLLLVGLALSLPAAAAAAPFGEPVPVRGAGLATTVLAAQGRTLVLARGSAIYATGRGAPQFLGWGEHEPRAELPQTDAVLVEGPDGTRVVAWAENLGDGSARMALAPPGARFGPTRSWRRPAEPTSLDAAVAGDVAVVAWTSAEGICVARARGGRWRGRPVTLPGTVGAIALDLDAGPDATIAIAWVAGGVMKVATGPAFGDVQTVPGTAGPTPVVFALADGGLLVSSTLRSAQRRTTEGAWEPERAIAGDEELAQLAAGAGAVSPVVVRDRQDYAGRTVIAWPGGSETLLQEFAAIPDGQPQLVFGEGRGPVVVGGSEHGVVRAGAVPGQLTIYAAHAGRLYALRRPHGADRRAPTFDVRGPSTFRRSSPDRTVWVSASVTEAATVHVRAFVRQGGAWRRVSVRVLHASQHVRTQAPFDGFTVEIPLPVEPGGCGRSPRWAMRVDLSAEDRSGHVGRRGIRRTVACHEER